MTLYQLPLSPWFLQIVTCSAPTLSLWAGCDMVVSFSLSSGRDHHGLTARQEKRPQTGSSWATVNGRMRTKRHWQGWRLAALDLAAVSQRKPVIERPVGCFSVPSERTWLRMVQREEGDLSPACTQRRREARQTPPRRETRQG